MRSRPRSSVVRLNDDAKVFPVSADFTEIRTRGQWLAPFVDDADGHRAGIGRARRSTSVRVSPAFSIDLSSTVGEQPAIEVRCTVLAGRDKPRVSSSRQASDLVAAVVVGLRDTLTR